MSVHSELPLCVDLDGTLIHTDALVESAVRSFLRAPAATLAALGSLRHGRAAFKARVLRHGSVDIASLPFNTPLIDRLRAERAAGRKVVLVTAANEHVARAVQEHLQLFDEVFASSEAHNLKGSAKGRFLVERYGEGGFVYVGDSAADRAVWSKAGAAWTVGHKGLQMARQTGVPIDASFAGATATAADWSAALRVDQWLWNVLVFVPWLLARPAATQAAVSGLGVALVCFCLAGSGMALFAAVAALDGQGRQRPDSGHPISAGRISLVQAGLVGGGLVAVAGLASLAVSLPLAGVLAVFVACRVAFAMRPTANAALAWLQGAWTLALRPLAGGTVVAAALSPLGWLSICACAAALAIGGAWTGRRAA